MHEMSKEIGQTGIDTLDMMLQRYGLSTLLVLVILLLIWRGLPVIFHAAMGWIERASGAIREEFDRQSKMLERQASSHEAVTEGLRKTFIDTLNTQREECAQELKRQWAEWREMLAIYQEGVKINVGNLTSAISGTSEQVARLRQCADDLKKRLDLLISTRINNS